MQNTAKQNYPGSTASYDTRRGLIPQHYQAHTGLHKT